MELAPRYDYELFQEAQFRRRGARRIAILLMNAPSYMGKVKCRMRHIGRITKWTSVTTLEA